MKKGKVLAFVGASGVGKTTLMKDLILSMPDEVFPLKTTTSRKRRGPEDDLFYNFRSLEEVRDLQARGEMVEYGEYAGNGYGCLKSDFDWALNQGHGVQAFLEDAIADMRKKLYRVVPIKVVSDVEVIRDVERVKLDQERARIHVDYDLVIKNSFAPGGLEKSMKQLTDFVKALPK